MTGPAPRRLAVRLPNPAGDVVLATPALRALRRALPAAHVVWAGRPAALALLDGLEDRDATLAVAGPLDRGPRAPWRLGRRLREEGVDAVLVLPGSLSSAIAARASGAAVRVGDARRGRRRLLTHAVEAPRAGRAFAAAPMREHYLRLAAVLGATDDGGPPALRVTAEGEALARERLRDAGLAEPFVAVSPGAAFGPAKVYPPALLADAVDRVRAATGWGALVLCGPGEEALAADVARRMRPPVASTHARVAAWPEAKALLARAALLVTPDAGPRHVAAALGRPVVVLAGPTDPRWGSGDADRVTVVRREGLFCLGCHLRTCPIGHPCLSGLDPALVAEACLARAGAAPTGARVPLPSRG